MPCKQQSDILTMLTKVVSPMNNWLSSILVTSLTIGVTSVVLDWREHYSQIANLTLPLLYYLTSHTHTGKKREHSLFIYTMNTVHHTHPPMPSYEASGKNKTKPPRLPHATPGIRVRSESSGRWSSHFVLWGAYSGQNSACGGIGYFGWIVMGGLNWTV